ncbi:hypothetical protein KJ891_04570 [Candidatus Micrarchaeota archaeon]|nr:hypothetical protein [Candidatus Micrarchaeota archaeon]
MPEMLEFGFPTDIKTLREISRGAKLHYSELAKYVVRRGFPGKVKISKFGREPDYGLLFRKLKMLNEGMGEYKFRDEKKNETPAGRGAGGTE